MSDLELIERMKAEPVLDAGDGPFVELWEADFKELLRLSALSVEGWQDIETAPKDGSTIIGTGLNHGTGPARHMALVYWDEDRHQPGFYDRGESQDRYVYLDHWCPANVPSATPPALKDPES